LSDAGGSGQSQTDLAGGASDPFKDCRLTGGKMPRKRLRLTRQAT
jgi:hypothetical protein